jgi:protein TonB
MSTVPHTIYPRWSLAVAIAFVLHLVFMFLFVRIEPKRILTVQPRPNLVLDYVVLPPMVKPKKKPLPKPPPVKEKKVEVLPEPEPLPEPVAPVAVSEPAPLPAEVVSAPPQKTAPPVMVTGIAGLDNTDFIPLYNPKPAYPALARVAGIEGEVVVELIIDQEGKVRQFSIISTRGHQQFALETSKVVRHWRFPPPRVGGEPVKVKYEYTVRFQLE